MTLTQSPISHREETTLLTVPNQQTRVPVDEAHGVDSIQSQHHLSSVKARPFLWDIIVAHQIHQVTTWHVLHHHIEVAVILECKKELRKRRRVK